MVKPKANNLTYLDAKRNTGYRHLDKDPVLEKVMGIIRNSGTSYAKIQEKSGVTAGTLHRWDKGDTRRPQHRTMEFALRAVGYHFPDPAPIPAGKRLK